MTCRRRKERQRGSVVLVALCFVIILGIALGSYLAISNQAMKLANRSYLKSVTNQLSESGLELALASFSRNDWDPAVWNISGTTARRTVSVPANKYGSGLSGTINLRIDNFDAYYRSSIWDASTNYKAGDLVGRLGTWYRALQANLNKTPPDISAWAPAPVPSKWTANSSYYAGTASANASTVFYGSSWYYCILDAPAGTFPTNTTYWSVIPILSFSWDTSTNYTAGSFVYSGGTWYRCTASHTNHPPPDPSYWSANSPAIIWAYRTGVTYNFNDVVYWKSGSGTDKWYRCIAPSTTSDPSDISSWQDALNGSWGWSSSTVYNLNDVVYFGGSFYRCILAHSNHGPPDTKYWQDAPLLDPNWDINRLYNVNDVVSFDGVWYRCTASNTGRPPLHSSDASSGYWAPALQSIASWYSTKTYNLDDIVSFGAGWYRCTVSHLNQLPTNTSFWSLIDGATYQWDPATSYGTGSYVSYAGIWYQCLATNTNQTPNNETYWKALVAPVVYAEGVLTSTDGSAPIRTQIRATVNKSPLFPNAVAATSTVKINGAGTVNSYDASLENKAVNPSFSGSIANPGFSASLASTTTNYAAAITISGAKVNGYVAAPSDTSSPFAPLWAYTTGSAILTGISTGTGIDLTRVSRSPYVPQFEILPKPDLATAFTSANFCRGILIPDPSVADTVLSLGTPGAVTPSRYYFDGSLRLQSGSGSYYKTININGPIILYVNGSFRVQSGGTLDIKTTGAAEIHCNYLRIESGSNGVINRTWEPKKLSIISDNASVSPNITLDVSTNPQFCGVYYAPNLSSTLGLEIKTGVEFFGAISARKVTFSGDANLHYDTSLRYASFGGINTPFAISEWRELIDQSERITLP